MREQLVESAAQTYGGTNRCTSITVHETSNQSLGADAQAHANLQSSGNVRQASWHIQVDDTEAIRSYPDSAQCWHAGPAAADSIAVEICVNADGDYEAAFKNAAEVVAALRAEHGIPRSKVYDHAHWTGKNCPSAMRATGRWQEFLNLTEGATPVSTMISPFQGRLTQNHGDGGGYRGHKGTDVAPPKPGQTGKPVYAAFAGTVRKLHRTAKHGNRNSTWAPGRTGNGGLVSNPDGEGNGYNHMTPLSSLRVGHKVKPGQLIGYNDSSGTQTGPHLHFELWANWKDSNSDYDAQLAFKKFGVKAGSAPAKTSGKPSTPAAANSKDDNIAIAKALNLMGYDAGYPDGVDGPMMQGAVRAFQEDHGLYPDEEWGPVTQAKYEALGRPKKPIKATASKPAKTYRNLQNGSTGADVGKVQQALRNEGYTKQTVDKDFGDQTEANVRDFQRRTGLVIDGIAAEITQKRLGL